MYGEDWGYNEIDRLTPTGMLEILGGYYERPTDASGKRFGPLVGYAGKHPSAQGEKQYVGEVYANFAAAEEYPLIMQSWADKLFWRARIIGIDHCLGMPLGGLTFAFACALRFKTRFGYLEKKVLQAGSGDHREKSELVFGRHKVRPGEGVALVEDVCNNFSTTREAIEVIEKAGGKPKVIFCIFNRSGITEFPVREDLLLPVISVEHKTLPEYRQDDPYVVEDIARGNLRSKPKTKEVWEELQAVMQAAK